MCLFIHPFISPFIYAIHLFICSFIIYTVQHIFILNYKFIYLFFTLYFIHSSISIHTILHIHFSIHLFILYLVCYRLTGQEKRVGGFDLMWNDGPVAMDDACGADCIPQPLYPTNTFLGKNKM